MSLLERLNKLPNEVNGFELSITKDFDEWVIEYQSDFGYLKSPIDRHNTCHFSSTDIEEVVNKTLDWLNDHYKTILEN